MKTRVAILVVLYALAGWITFSILPFITAASLAAIGNQYETLKIDSSFGEVSVELNYDNPSSGGSSSGTHMQWFYPFFDLIFAIIFGFVMTCISIRLLRQKTTHAAEQGAAANP